MPKKYSFDDHPEHKKMLKPWVDKWIANAMSTVPMTESDRDICRAAVKRLYEEAGLTPPPLERIVFVSSPFVLRFAGGFAAEIWRKRGLTDAATRDAAYATRDATYAATRDAAYDATDAATRDAAYDATDAAYDATTDATYAATDAATRDVNLSNWYVVSGDM